MIYEYNSGANKMFIVIQGLLGVKTPISQSIYLSNKEYIDFSKNNDVVSEKLLSDEVEENGKKRRLFFLKIMKEITDIRPKHHFGENALNSKSRRESTVYAKEPSLLLILEDKDYKKAIISASPSVCDSGASVEFLKRCSYLSKFSFLTL
jgi:CRP-like cAMP-binding protein